MHTVKLKLKNRSYDIVVGGSILKLLGKYILKLNIGLDAYVITNNNIKNKYGLALESALKKYKISAKFKAVADSEKSKSIETVASIIKDLIGYDKKKRLFIIAFGGGVIGDLAGFVASIYKRGIPYIQIPTTLLAQVDSSIGGKTAVDLAQGKNLIGAFYQPRLVFSDIHLLRSLNKEQLASGLAEVIKYGLIKNSKLFNFLEIKIKDILNFNLPALEYIIKSCSAIKASVVAADEKEERGLRTILNFGHTLGHAIETAGGFKRYAHGQAIALGMLLACDLSAELGILNAKEQERIELLIKKTGLPAKIEKISLEKIIKAHYFDKKFKGASNKFVLLEKIGKVKIVKNIPLKLIKDVLRKRIR